MNLQRKLDALVIDFVLRNGGTMRMRSVERKLAKQFLSEYDIVVPSKFKPQTNGPRRQS